MQVVSSGSVSTFEGDAPESVVQVRWMGFFFLLGVDQKGDVLRV